MHSKPNLPSSQIRPYWIVSHVFETNRSLRAIECYGEAGKWGENTKLPTLQFDTKIFVNIIISDYLLRKTVQQEEIIKRMSKEAIIYHQRTETEHQALRHNRHKYSEIEQSFYLSESMLPLGNFVLGFLKRRVNVVSSKGTSSSLCHERGLLWPRL